VSSDFNLQYFSEKLALFSEKSVFDIRQMRKTGVFDIRQWLNTPKNLLFFGVFLCSAGVFDIRQSRGCNDSISP
jgi:hypothetical protein